MTRMRMLFGLRESGDGASVRWSSCGSMAILGDRAIRAAVGEELKGVDTTPVDPEYENPEAMSARFGTELGRLATQGKLVSPPILPSKQGSRSGSPSEHFPTRV